MSMDNKIVTFGEIMLRLSAPGAERLLQSPQFAATFGGGEANVAVAVSGFDCRRHLSRSFRRKIRLPMRPFPNCAASVSKPPALFGQGPHGNLFSRSGANQRPSRVVYDREFSAIAQAKPGDIDWKSAFDGAAGFM
jgi:2-dehydro-3-deoxygluconokinase